MDGWLESIRYGWAVGVDKGLLGCGSDGMSHTHAPDSVMDYSDHG